MKKIQSGEGASDFGTVDKESQQPPLADWEKELLDAAVLRVPLPTPETLVAGGCDATPGYANQYQTWMGVVPPTDPSPAEPLKLPAPLDEKWITDVIYDNWKLHKDRSGFPHWITNAAKIIIAGQ